MVSCFMSHLCFPSLHFIVCGLILGPLLLDSFYFLLNFQRLVPVWSFCFLLPPSIFHPLLLFRFHLFSGLLLCVFSLKIFGFCTIFWIYFILLDRGLHLICFLFIMRLKTKFFNFSNCRSISCGVWKQVFTWSLTQTMTLATGKYFPLLKDKNLEVGGWRFGVGVETNRTRGPYLCHTHHSSCINFTTS